MRKGDRVTLNADITKQTTDITKQIIDKAKGSQSHIPYDHLLTYYLASYLPIISDSLASIADSLEILAKDLEEMEDKDED